MIEVANVPKELNGYPVIKIAVHENCATVMMDAPGKYVVATWFPSTGDGWTWGHYFHVNQAGDDSKAFVEAHVKFGETSFRNRDR